MTSTMSRMTTIVPIPIYISLLPPECRPYGRDSESQPAWLHLPVRNHLNLHGAPLGSPSAAPVRARPTRLGQQRPAERARHQGRGLVPPGTQVKGDRGPGTARAGQDLDLIGYLPHYPQAMAGRGLPRAHHGRAGSAIRLCGPSLRTVGYWPGRIAGRWRPTVLNLTVQCSSKMPYPQPPCSRAMANGVGCQLVNDQHHIPRPTIRQSRLAGMSLDFFPQRVQRA
jgi:hypothetical protein